MHIFLTGASGFIGKNLVPYLLSRECQLTCLLRDPNRLPEELRSQVAVVVGDVTDIGPAVAGALASVEAVVHLAGCLWGHTYDAFDRVNRQGTEALVTAVNQANMPLRRFVQLSTLAAAGPARPGEPLTEDSPVAPISWYGQTKLGGERALAAAGFPWSIIRPPTVYGPHDQDVWRFFKMAARHLRPSLRGGHLELSLIHVRDVCQAIWLVLTRETRPQSTYFINDGQAIHYLRDVTALVAEAVRTWTIPVPLPGGLVRLAEGVMAIGRLVGLKPARLTPDKLRELRQGAWTCSADLITEQLGFKPSVRLAQGITETTAWYRAHGWL
ncbi:MAG: NAD-dependent epimerase/dehydratase family protein [Candidatus Neomarinimicrobiota bacterium]